MHNFIKSIHFLLNFVNPNWMVKFFNLQRVEFKTPLTSIFEPRHKKTCLSYVTNKDTDQPAHLRSLLSAFVVGCLDSIIPILAMSKLSRL